MSNEQERRKALKQQARESSAPQAGVYAIRNSVTGKLLIASNRNLKNIAGRIDFAKSTSTTSFFGHRLKDDLQQYGVHSFTFEPLETLSIKPEMTAAQIDADLKELEALVRQRFDPAELYE